MPEREEQGGREPASPEALLRQLSVADLVLGTLVSLVEVGHVKLGEGETGQTRLAIEVLRAVQPVVEEAVPPEALRELRQATASLQLAYADAVRGASRPSPAYEQEEQARDREGEP